MNVESHSDANGAMNEFFYTVRGKLDERLATILNDIKNAVSPVDSQPRFVEAVYANRELFTAAELEPVIAIAEFAGGYNFGSLRGGRTEGIISALRGEDPDPLPEPEPAYLPPPPAEEVEDPPEGEGP